MKKKDLTKVKKEVAEYVRIQKGLGHLTKINAERIPSRYTSSIKTAGSLRIRGLGISLKGGT